MSHLEKAQALLNDEFPSGWLNEIIGENTLEVTSITERLVEKLSVIEDKLFDHLNLSIIRGEYIKNISDTQRQVFSLKNKLEELQSIAQDSLSGSIDDLSNFFIDIYLDKYKSGFLDPLGFALEYYSYFLTQIKRALNFSDNEIAINYHEAIIQANGLGNANDQTVKNIKLLNANIDVAEADHFLSIDNGHLALLIEVKTKLLSSSEYRSAPYSVYIRDKANFLLNKLALRLRKETPKTRSLYLVKNGIEERITSTSLRDGTVFDQWIDQAGIHYEIADSWEQYTSESFEKSRKKKLEDCSISELHCRIKYYKDIYQNKQSSIEHMLTIGNEILRRKNLLSDSEDLDNYTLSVNHNYASNNYLSLVSNKESDKHEEEVYAVYEDVLQQQSTSGIKNFFPQTRILKYCLQKLEDLYKSRKALDIKKSRGLIDRCNSVYATYKENVEWTKEHYNYVFQLSFEECCLQLNDTNVGRIYVFSSFILPLPKDKYIEEFEYNKKQVDQVENSVKVLENVEPELSNLQDREVRALEILGIFTALISFVVASLPTFAIIKTAPQAALFTLALATSFSSFILLLLITLRRKTRTIISLIVLFLILAAAIITWILLVSQSENNVDKAVINMNASSPPIINIMDSTNQPRSNPLDTTLKP